MNGWEIKSTILLPILPENRKTFLKRVLSHSETKLICDQSRELEVSLGHLPLQHKNRDWISMGIIKLALITKTQMKITILGLFKMADFFNKKSNSLHKD